jgi:hypothetical protein
LTSEGKDDTAPKHIEQAMTIIYPPVLGLFESPMQICLKSLSCMRLVSTVPPLQFGLQRWGVWLHLFLAGSRGVLIFLAFEGLLRGRLQGWSGYCISICEHQTGYRGQWRD